ncbi:MAG: hypothetical protein FWD01_00010 [Defluviitaleaceae bacterium]|nr:hypothetical protein [Defluviitaleaceae bacterium]
MDFFQWILIIFLICGVALVVYSLRNFYGTKTESDHSEGVADVEIDSQLAEKLSTYKNYVTEADEAINELNDVSRSVFREFDNKYQELLFLYNLVEEKKQELATPLSLLVSTSTEEKDQEPVTPLPVSSSVEEKDQELVTPLPLPVSSSDEKEQVTTATEIPQTDYIINDDTKASTPVSTTVVSRRFAPVLELRKKGMSIDEIAQTLDMGKGEVMLIINLGGDDRNA